MSKALKGLRVIELGTGPVTGVAGMILADFGAEVLRIDTPPGDRLSSLPAAPLWSRGKQRHALDIRQSEDRNTLFELAAGADVFLTNLRASTLDAHGLNEARLREDHPHLVYCHISGFGARGPLADLPGYEHAVAAYAGRMLQFQGVADRPGPVVSAVQVGVHMATQSAVAGILAALLARGETGSGRLVETSMLQAMLPYDMGNLVGFQFKEAHEAMLPAMEISPAPPPPSLYYHPAQAGDGRWLQFGNLLPHLFDNFLIATELVDVLADPAFDPKQMLLQPAEQQEAFRERMLSRLQEKPADTWMAHFIADGGIVATPYQTTQQALKDPDVVDNGHVIPMGEEGVQLGPLARLSSTPAEPGAATSDRNNFNEWHLSPRPAPASGASLDPPLKGIRVVEIATIIAAPLGAAFLADMGAEVTKVEQVGGDPFRGMLGGLGAARVNAGKKSISVNLKTEAGRQLVLELIADADVLIHNYRPGVPERLGIGYEQVRALNPRIVYLQCNGYGPNGPGANRPSTHPVPGAAMGGVMYQMGGQLPDALQDFASLRTWCSRIMRANELNPDPNTAAVVATSAMLGLSARQRTGQGQRIIVDMFGANAYANADDFLAYPGKPIRRMPDELLHGYGPTYRLYACKDDSWVFLALVSVREKQLFRETLIEEKIDPPDLSPTVDEARLVAALGGIFQQRSADEWEALMTGRGIACVRADRHVPGTFWLLDEQSRQNNFVLPATHPVHGEYLRHGALVHFDGTAPELTGPPLAGEHNLTILAGLGHGPDECAAFAEAGVIWQEAEI